MENYVKKFDLYASSAQMLMEFEPENIDLIQFNFSKLIEH